MTRHERELKALEDAEKEKALRIKEIWDKPEKDPDYEVTQEERDEVADLTKALSEIDKKKEDVQKNIDLDREIRQKAGQIKTDEKPAVPDFSVRPSSLKFEKPQGLGDMFVESKEYKDVFGSGSVPQGQWETNPVELRTKATLSSGGTLGGYGAFEQNIPGVIPIADQPLVVADLMPSNAATQPQVRFFKERVATNAAAGVAESGVKPESVFDFNAETASLTKIATFVPVSDEMMEDAPALSNYLNQRLSMFIRTEEEQELLRGAGSGSNEIEGFIDNYALNSVGTATVSGAPGTLSFGELITALNNQRGSSMLDPDAIIMHPKTFGSILAAYDKNGQYYSGGPLTPGAYGAGNTMNSSRFGAWTLWNVPVHITTQVGDGTLLAGNFRNGAAVWRRGGISVQATNSHSDFFRRNQTMIRAEERVALTIYRPEAFTVINWGT